MNVGIILIFALLAAAVIAGVIYSAAQARKRREALWQLATRLGLSFTMAENRLLPVRYGFLNRLGQGENRYAYNVIEGVYQGHKVLAFDYHYETYSHDSKGHRQTNHHYFSCFILELPLDFPELHISPEGFFSKIVQAFGYDDIDFESAEFSRAFCVRSKDRKFAYDVCHAQMMEYLLANRDLVIEIELSALALAFNRCLDAPQFESNLQRLVAIRSLLPEYLFTKV
jgi:hypothetical protein